MTKTIKDFRDLNKGIMKCHECGKQLARSDTGTYKVVFYVKSGTKVFNNIEYFCNPACTKTNRE